MLVSLFELTIPLLLKAVYDIFGEYVVFPVLYSFNDIPITMVLIVYST